MCSTLLLSVLVTCPGVSALAGEDSEPHAMIVLRDWDPALPSAGRSPVNQDFAHLVDCPWALGWPVAFAAIDPTPVIRRMILDGSIGQLVGAEPPTPGDPPPPPAPKNGARVTMSPLQLIGVRARMDLVETRHGDNSTAAREASGVQDVIVTRLLPRDDGTAPITIASHTTFPINTPDRESDAVVFVQNVANLRGTSVIAPGLLSAKGMADLGIARVEVARGVTFIALSRAQAYLLKGAGPGTFGISPGAGFGIEVRSHGFTPAVFSMGGGPLLRLGEGAGGPGSAVMGEFELLLF